MQEISGIAMMVSFSATWSLSSKEISRARLVLPIPGCEMLCMRPFGREATSRLRP